MSTIATAITATATVEGTIVLGNGANSPAIQRTDGTVFYTTTGARAVSKKATAKQAGTFVATVTAPVAKIAKTAKTAPKGIAADEVAEAIKASVEVVRLAPKAQQARMNIGGVSVRGFAGGVFSVFGRATEGQWFFAAVDANGTIQGQGVAATRTGAKASAMKARAAIAAGSRAAKAVPAAS